MLELLSILGFLATIGLFIWIALSVAVEVGRNRERAERQEHELQARLREEYLALSDEEKLIAKIEEGKDVQEIRRLLDVAPLEGIRISDEVTPIIATMQQDYGHNTSRRYRILGEILRRLPKEKRAAALNARDKRGWTALRHAIERGSPVDCALLIHLGADPAVKDCSGVTALGRARAMSPRYPALSTMHVAILEGRGFPPNQPRMKEILEEVLSEWGRWPDKWP